MKKIIKIFLASSNRLKEERNEIELMIARENKKNASKGISFELVRWEQLPQSIQPKRIQDSFNEEMLKCEVVVVLFYNNVGNFTLEEFKIAHKSLKKGNNPRHLFVFFKSVQVSLDEVDDNILAVKKLKEKIESYEQIYFKYDSIDQLKNILKEQLDLIISHNYSHTVKSLTDDLSSKNNSKTQSSEKRKSPFFKQWFSLFFVLTISMLIGGIIIYQNIPYSFTITDLYLRSDAVLIIKSENWKTNKSKCLNVEFDGFKFTNKGKPVEKDEQGNQIWHFKINDLNPPKICLKDGLHKIRLGFPGKSFSKEVHQVYFITKPLIVEASLSVQKNGSQKSVLKGRAATESQLKDNTISVDVIFYHQGPTTVKNVPVKLVDDPDTQLVYFEFDTAFDGFPKISKNDPLYDKPFFKLKITDKAGNVYVQEHSYAQFVAAGSLRIAAGNARIKLNKFCPEGTDNLSTHLTYIPENQSQFSGKPPNIKLKVRSIAKDRRTLEWSSDPINQKSPHTLIYRNDEFLASTNLNKYTDTDVLSSKTVSYKVIKEDSSGVKYTSNVETVELVKTVTSNKAGQTWKDPLTKMIFVWIPPGCFQMGSPKDEKGRYSDEGPVHKVCVDGFWLGKYEVTRGQFRKFINTTNYKTDAEQEGSSYGYTNEGKWKEQKGYSWKKNGFKQDDSHPVISVSWNDAQKMAKWMSDQSKYKFKLPTEAEWEYACRGGTQTARYWGENPDQACRYANVYDKTAKEKISFSWINHNCSDNFVFTAPVGSFSGNSFHLFDMLGNVWEWCEDDYSSDAYKKHILKNPVVKNGGSDRVIRGGGWGDSPRGVRSAGRGGSTPGGRGGGLGFRLLRKK